MLILVRQILSFLNVLTVNVDIFSSTRKLKCIGHKIKEDLLEPLDVCCYLEASFRLLNDLILFHQLRKVSEVLNEVDTARFGFILLNHEDFFNGILQIKILTILSKFTSPDLSEIKKVVYQIVQNLGAGHLHFDTFLILLVDLF